MKQNHIGYGKVDFLLGEACQTTLISESPKGFGFSHFICCPMPRAESYARYTDHSVSSPIGQLIGGGK